MDRQPPQTQTPDLLRERGLRATSARCAVLDWLVGHPHATVEQVHHGVTRRIGSLSRQAVYDVLSACVDTDLVRQIKPAGHSARFERRTGDNHHHLICRACGHIEDVDCVRGEKPCLHPAEYRGFAVDEAEVMFWGICAPCRQPNAGAECPLSDNNFRQQQAAPAPHEPPLGG